MTSLVSMATADWFMVGVLIISLLIGALRGLVYEVLSVMGWIGAFFVAQWLTPDVAALLPFSSATPAIRFAAAFALTFIAGVFVASLLASLLKKLVAATGLRPADRLLGAFFGLARGLVLLLTAFGVQLEPELQTQIIATGLGLVGVINVMRKEKK